MSESDTTIVTHDIEWAMLDKSRYIPLNVLSTFAARSLLYPFTLVRTRLQVQVQSSIYRGTWHALTTTMKCEGFRSLYKGFVVYNFQLIPGLIYITTFESSRAQANILTKNDYIRAGIGGTVASLIAQILACPIDIISQHMQLVGFTSSRKETLINENQSMNSNKSQKQIHRIHVPQHIRHSNYLIFKYICKTLLYDTKSNNEKPRLSFRGFYRGYFISTFLFSLTSAIWWPSYYFYQKQMLHFESLFSNLFPLPLLAIQCIAGPLSSVTSTILTNPLDVCRTRIQVEQEGRKVFRILKELWHEERFNVFTKGLTARLSHSCVYSLFIIFGYETVKRVSLRDEYKEHVRW